MLKLVPGAGLSPAKTSSLLSLVAGDFAAAVARAWPAPHVAFLTAPAARRHLVCLALATGRDVPLRPLLAMRLRQAIDLALLNPPAGLARALTRLGETAWPAADYRKLLVLLDAPAFAKALRHAETLRPEFVRRLAATPTPLIPAAGVLAGLDEASFEVVADTLAAITFRSGPAAAAAAAGRWATAGSAKALFAAMKRDLYPEPAAPPFPASGRLSPLATRAAMEDAATRYRNCLRDQAPYAASGWSAYYEWAGPPGAIVELQRDGVFGWRLEQVRLAENAIMAEPDRQDLLDELALAGVHVGRSGWELDRALSAAAGSGVVHRLQPLEAAQAEAFGDD
jgi:hypothetical protein